MITNFTLESLIRGDVLTVGVPAETLGKEPPRNDPKDWLLLTRSAFLPEPRSG